MNPPTPHPFPDPADARFQRLEDMATAFWVSETLFAAIELSLFDRIEASAPFAGELAEAAGCRKGPLSRMLAALKDMGLVQVHDGRWCNTPVARRFLLTSGPEYMGDFLLYRRYLKPNWATLSGRVSRLERPAAGLTAEDDYAVRNYHYVRSTDLLARQKAGEIAGLLSGVDIAFPVLDAGGGAGAVSRRITAEQGGRAVLLDLPEVLAAARKIYPNPEDWERITPVAGDFRFGAPLKPGAAFGTVVLANFLHAYGPDEARRLLERAAARTAEHGLLLIHDYFPDVHTPAGARGALHDLNMMLNTYDGVCHPASVVLGWLREIGFEETRLEPLSSDSAVILAGRKGVDVGRSDTNGLLAHTALELGFHRAVPVPVENVAVAPWVRVKCRCGCGGFGKNLQCPPHSPAPDKTRALLSDFRRALLVVGEPPGRDFHEKLLALERAAFLAGYPKALVFGAGPCPVCDKCAMDDGCRFPKKARPSMEASGMDVYETARRSGVALSPVTDPAGYVSYIGLLLLE